MMGKRGRRHTGTKKTDCPFRLTGKMLAAGDEWELTVVEGKHNHEAEDTTGKQLGHSFKGRLSQEEEKLVKDLRKTGKQPKEILRELKKRDKHNKSEPRTIYNACQRLKPSRSQQLISQAEKYGFIEKHRTRPKMKSASDLLFTHPTSLEVLLALPSVLIIQHKEWVMRSGWAGLRVYGGTSTDKIFLVALAFTSEHGGSYEWDWVLTSFRDVMNDYGITMPDIVILDMWAHSMYCDTRYMGTCDTRMEGLDAIKDVFPTAKVLLSMDTMFRFVESYTRKISKLNTVERKTFKKKWKLLIASPTEADLERHVMQLRTEFDRYPESLEYVTDTLLKPYKEMFVAAWTDKVMHFGIINLSYGTFWFCESMLIDYLLHAHHVNQTQIDKYWKELHELIADDKAGVKALLQESLENGYDYGFPKAKLLHGTISINAVDMIREQTIKAIGIDDDYGEYCTTCAIRSTRGLPCAHEIATYRREDRPIPPECINSFWKKLDLKPFSKTAEPLIDESIKRRRLSEEKNADTGSVILLPDIVESERNSPNAGPSVVPSTQERQPDDEVDLDIPSTMQLEFAEMRPYILDVKDVPRDGHCGFRAIASFVGYSEDVGWLKVREDLKNELLLNSNHYGQLFGSDERVDELLLALEYQESICLQKKHWMTMPDMGHIIASCYNIVLVHLSSAQCFTFFPVRTAPISISVSSPIEIVLGFSEDHFMQVYLKKGHPMPPPVQAPTRKKPHVATIWERIHEQRSTEWATPYLGRIEQFRSLQREAVSQKNPIPVYLDLL